MPANCWRTTAATVTLPISSPSDTWSTESFYIETFLVDKYRTIKKWSKFIEWVLVHFLELKSDHRVSCFWYSYFCFPKTLAVSMSSSNRVVLRLYWRSLDHVYSSYYFLSNLLFYFFPSFPAGFSYCSFKDIKFYDIFFSLDTFCDVSATIYYFMKVISLHNVFYAKFSLIKGSPIIEIHKFFSDYPYGECGWLAISCCSLLPKYKIQGPYISFQ